MRLRVAAAGICGTDVHICRGDLSMSSLIKPPVTLGHEFCGYVDKLGAGVDEVKLPLGTYASAEMHEICGECPACRSGAFHACALARIRGINLNGAFAEFVVVSAGNVVVLPKDLPVPQDDGAARHLTGMRLPDVALPATDGSTVIVPEIAASSARAGDDATLA